MVPNMDHLVNGRFATQPPPAHMGIPPVHIDTKGMNGLLTDIDIGKQLESLASQN